MLWLLVFGWALGASLVILAFAIGVGRHKFGLAAVIFIVGIAVLATSVMKGNAYHDSTHGVRPDEPTEFATPGGT